MTRLSLVLVCVMVPVMQGSPAVAEKSTGFPSVVTCDAPRVIDGDTFVCGDERIRLWGVDAVERGQPGYREAGDYLHSLTQGRVKCEGKTRDKYRRLVGKCYVNGSDLAAQMVRAGHAVDYPRYSRGYYRNVR